MSAEPRPASDSGPGAAAGAGERGLRLARFLVLLGLWLVVMSELFIRFW